MRPPPRARSILGMASAFAKTRGFSYRAKDRRRCRCGVQEVPLEISVRRQDGVQLIRLRGDFRLGEAVDAFRTTVEELVEAGEVRLVVNVADVRMIDSSGIGALVHLLTATTKSGGGMKLVQPSKMTLQTLRLTGLLNIIPVYDDETGAVASFS